nr:DUF3426 domain-containing protein [uncultured Pseudomonas sp.]
MTESFVTQCPHCRTSFRVNRAQLGAAHGAVRCGACLHVFNAAQQLLAQRQNPPAVAHSSVATSGVSTSSGAMPGPAKPNPQAAPVAKTPHATATPPGKKPSDTLWIHDDLDLDSLDLDEELAKLEQQEQQLSQQFRDLEQAPKYAEAFNRPPRVDPEPHDERWAEALLHETPAKAPLSIAPSDNAPAQPARAVQTEAPVSAPARPATIEPERQKPTPTAPTAKAPVRDSVHIESAEPLDQNAEDDLEPPIEPVANKARKAPRSEPGLRDEHLFELDDEPLQLDWQPPKKPWGRRLGWALLNLIAAGALAGQYAHYHFDELARQDHYRPWFEQLCPLIGCTLPSKVDINQIKSSNLVVRSHPEFSGALIVDAIIYNRAPFAQPFPLLEIRFADINGRLLASRRFKPGEYLAGELAGKEEMPPQVPIHISLDILDPGSQAVNYSLSFHSPE